MCNESVVIFGTKHLSNIEIEGKRVIEVGSYNVNGSLRSLIESWNPVEYVGVDLEKGPGVDMICNAEDLVKKFGKESFDVVISTELLEHVLDWKTVISNFKNICKPGGIILITARSYGFPYHGYPSDFWRFELEDMKEIFSDSAIISLKNDYSEPGILIKAKKPEKFIENDLSNYKLYSLVNHKKSVDITEDLKNINYRFFIFKKMLKEKLNSWIIRIYGSLFSKN